MDSTDKTREAATATPETSQSATQYDLFRELRWPLLFGLVCLLPALFFYGQALWEEKSHRFFPLLILSTLGFYLFHVFSKSESVKIRKPGLRRGFGMGIGFVAGVLAILAALQGSAWIGVAALGLVVFAIFLLSVQLPWPKVAAWTLPLFALLLIPASQSDFDNWFDQSVMQSSSSLLDLMSTPNLPNTDRADRVTGLVLKDFVVNPRVVRTYLGSPYLLLCLTLAMLFWFRTNALVGFFTLLSVPLWAWFQSVLRTTLGVILFNNYGYNSFAGTNRLIVGGVVLVMILLFVATFIVALRKLLKHFRNTSSSTGTSNNEVHKLYNLVVYWPSKDPTRRRSASSDDEEIEFEPLSWQHWLIGVCFLASVVIFSFQQMQ